MKFYDRETELKVLHLLFTQAQHQGRMAVLTGRRRVGKTSLAIAFVKPHKHIYLFISKKPEPLLCKEFIEIIRGILKIDVIGDIKNFKDVFTLLVNYSKTERFTLILDEFQEFYNINPAVYSEMQNIWDRHKKQCKLNLIVIGSVYSLMHKIFESSKEPLFGRSDRILFIKPFPISTLTEILKDHHISNLKTIFDYYVITGGIPKYVELCIENDVTNFQTAIDFIISADSPLIREGKNLLIEEFGKDYGVYFSILELIASGKTSRTEIESLLEHNIGGYLERLLEDYALIKRIKPITAKPRSKFQKYKVCDNFIKFWFHFINRNNSALEAQNYEYIKEIIQRDYSTYSGRMLEQYFHQKFSESGKYTHIGTYWEKGYHNEIDLVAVNAASKQIVLADIKLDKRKLDINKLKQKAGPLLKLYPEYTPSFIGLGLDNVLDNCQEHAS